MDMGAYVVIVNAEKVVVTGNKFTQKVYTRHTGRPGSRKEETFQKLQAVRRPCCLLVEGLGCRVLHLGTPGGPARAPQGGRRAKSCRRSGALLPVGTCACHLLVRSAARGSAWPLERRLPGMQKIAMHREREVRMCNRCCLRRGCARRCALYSMSAQALVSRGQ